MVRETLFSQMLDLKRSLVDRCSVCNGTGIVDDRECDCRIIQRYLNHLIEVKIPSEYWELSFSDLTDVKPQKLVDLCITYSKHLAVACQKSMGLLLSGPNGRGKTSLQCAVGKVGVVQGFSVQYFTAQQYIEAVKAKNVELLSEYESGSIVLLDELDKVYIAQGSNFVGKTLEEFIRRMFSRGTAFIICTNLLESDLERTFGQSTMSILRGHLNFLLLEGDDYRNTQMNGWLSRLQKDMDYRNPHILKYARQLFEREQREDSIGWFDEEEKH